MYNTFDIYLYVHNTYIFLKKTIQDIKFQIFFVKIKKNAQ